MTQETYPRPLTDGERALVLAIMSAEEFRGQVAGDWNRWRDQVDGLRVVGGCECGCPTIDFRPLQERGRTRREGVAPSGPAPFNVMASVRDSEDFLILFAVDGQLDRLEYVPGSDRSLDGLQLPSVQDLELD